MYFLALAAALAIVTDASQAPIGGRVVESRGGTAIAGAEISVVGSRGTVRTDAEGRFEWAVLPALPADVLVTLPDGRVTRPIRLTSDPGRNELTLAVDPAVSESVAVVGSAPGIDVAPAAATATITARELQMRHAATLPQALDGIPGVSAISEGQAAVPAIRGMARGRTLILVDGSRAVTERRAGANASFLDPGIVESLEIARGPGSVAYGSDAFGGVIAARTRGPSYERRFGVRFAGTAGAGVPLQRGDLELSTGYGSGGILVGVRSREYDDYESPAGRIVNSSWRDRGVRVRWEQRLGGGAISAGMESDFGRALGRPRSDSDVMRVTSPFEDTHRFTASYERGSLGIFRNLRLDALAGAGRQRTDQERLPAGTRPRTIDSAEMSWRDVQLRATAEHTFRSARISFGGDVQGVYGLHATESTMTFNAAGATTSSSTSVSIDKARRTAAGAFAQMELPLTSWIRASGGIRTDTVRNRNDGGFFGDRAARNSSIAALGAATVTPLERLTITAQAARGFRDPTLSDRFYRGVVGRGFIQGNPDLQPETSRQFDVNARYAGGGWQLQASAYRYRIANLVERYAATATSFLFRNRGAALLYGVELEASTALPGHFRLTASGETSRGRDALDRTPLDDIAPAAATLTLRHHAGARTSSYVRVKALGSHRAAGPSEVPTTSYTLAEGGFEWRLSRAFELHGTVRNIFNERYQSSAGPRWVWAPGRNAALTAVVKY